MNLLKLSKEELIAMLQDLNNVYDEVMGGMTEIRNEFLDRLTKEKKDGEIVGEYQVSKTKRITFKTTLEQAEELGAIKKAPDTKILKNLHDKGVKVPGTSETVYLSVRKLKQDVN